METTSESARLSWKTHLLALAAYGLLALALTWPLALRLGSHVPGNGVDDPPLTWNLWWARHALLSQPGTPFACDVMFYPIGANLAFYTLTLLNGVLSLPLQAAGGLVAASNLILLSSFVLSGYGAFLLARYLLRSGRRQSGASEIGPAELWPAFVAGVVYAFASSKLGYAALGQWNIASSQWIPFYVLFVFRLRDEPGRWRNAVLAGLCLAFQAWAEMTYASFLLVWSALFAAAYLYRRGTGWNWGLLARLLAAGAVFAAAFSPHLAAMIPDLRAEGDFFVEGEGFAGVFSADLVGFGVPTQYHPLLGGLVDRFAFPHDVGQHLYVGAVLLALGGLACVVAWRRPEVRFWAASAGLFWLLTLGPSLRVNGHDTGVPLPFALLAKLPFFKGNRYPSRYSVLLMLSLAMLAAMGLAYLLRAMPRRTGKRTRLAALAPLALSGLFLFEHLSAPLPMTDLTVPAVYQAIAAEGGEGTLLDLPVAWRNGFRVLGTMDPVIMFEQYYQTVHGRRILAGNTSRNPELTFQYFADAPVINSLIALETGKTLPPAVVTADANLAPEVLRLLDVRWVIVRPEFGAGLVPYVEATMPVERAYADGEMVAYRVQLPPAPDRFAVTPADPLWRLVRAEGWGQPVQGEAWAQRREARLLLPLPGSRLVLRVYAPGEGQTLTPVVNGRALAPVTLAPGWGEVAFELPAGVAHAGLNDLRLRFSRLWPAGAAQLTSRQVGQTGDASPVGIAVQSAGWDLGGFDLGHIFVDGEDVSPNGRGYNLAVIDADTGVVQEVATFDTHGDPEASAALAAFVEGLPSGQIVAGAVADEASLRLTEEAVAALLRLGASGDLRERFRWGHAFVGVVDSPPGTAQEALGWLRPISLSVGDGLTEAQVAAALAEVRVEGSPPGAAP